MGKILFWFVLITAGLMLARILARQHERRERPPVRPIPRAAKTPNVASAPQPEAMVRCTHCGIHLPRSEAVLSGGQTWCSTEHARLGQSP